MEKCNCPLCDELNLEDPQTIIESYLDRICSALINDASYQSARDIASALFSEGYKLGFITSSMTRIEEEVEAVKYITNNWNV